jgi:hypothetical protein
MSFAIGAAQSVMQYQAASAEVERQNALYAQNKQNSLNAFTETQKQLTTRQIQEEESAGAEKFDQALETKKAMATEQVAAGEAGISGLSLEHLMRDLQGQSARFNDRVDQNKDWAVTQLQMEKKGQGYQTLDRINSVQKAIKPSFASVGLRILGSGVDSMTSYKNMTK